MEILEIAIPRKKRGQETQEPAKKCMPNNNNVAKEKKTIFFHQNIETENKKFILN